MTEVWDGQLFECIHFEREGTMSKEIEVKSYLIRDRYYVLEEDYGRKRRELESKLEAAEKKIKELLEDDAKMLEEQARRERIFEKVRDEKYQAEAPLEKLEDVNTELNDLIFELKQDAEKAGKRIEELEASLTKLREAVEMHEKDIRLSHNRFRNSEEYLWAVNKTLDEKEVK